MPLRDHFHPPAAKIAPWSSLHTQWPAEIVKHLRQRLPEGFVAAATVHLGTSVEIDVAAFERHDSHGRSESDTNVTAFLSPPKPSVDVEKNLPDEDEFEVQIYDMEYERRLLTVTKVMHHRVIRGARRASEETRHSEKADSCRRS